MDLNELLYAHQLAVMHANAPHASIEGRESHFEEASNYADKIRLMPGALDISPATHPDNAVSQSPAPGETDDSPSSRNARNLAVLSAWESEGGAVSFP